mmetsp:Transcript_11584/g.24720  ORF Transcript_11584/g.24720 Transcript_11584/m.24720 type:complete len:269 (-) Transcript_11584:154-960(-)
MRHDISSNRFRRVLSKRHSVRIGHDLVGNKHRHAELLGETGQLPQKLGKLHLSLGELATARIIGTVERRGGIDDDERVPILGHDGRGHFEEFSLVLAVVGAGVGDVLERDVGIHSESLGDGLEALWPEGTLCVNVNGFALSPTVRNRHLASNTKRMTQLRLPCAKFSKHLCQRSRLNPTFEQLIQLRRSGGERHERLSILQRIRGGLEVHGNKLFDNVLELEDLRLGEAADLGQFADGGVSDGFDGVKSGIVELLDVVRGDALFLEEV